MEDWLRRLQGNRPAEAPEPPKTWEAMTTPKVNFNYQIYWTKVTLNWTAERRAIVREQVLAITRQDDFQGNLLEKRYHLPIVDIPEQYHSGASLEVLVAVLNAHDNIIESE